MPLYNVKSTDGPVLIKIRFVFKLLEYHEIVSEIKLSKKNYPCNRPWRPMGCEMSRIPHFLDNRLTDVGKVASLTALSTLYYPRKISGTHFC
jgi:hypothetical protein